MTTTNMNLVPIEKWGVTGESPLIISGPCSAETADQVMETARALVKHAPQVKVFRAGIWKPRTRPNSFEGIGIEGLSWLQQVKAETGLLTSVEVANANHVYEALKHGIDILWVGARTTVNPFSVQEIANALRGVDVPVMIKNPINPDLQLWLGAIERIHLAGITRLGAIHRGFSSGQNGRFRNAPQWKLAIELKRLLPDLPMVCDPSHICGRRDTLLEISQKALDLAMDGLMLESHPNPDEAWSDKNQQLTPVALAELLGQLKLRKPEGEDSETVDFLSLYRDEIDLVDLEILDTIARRAKVVEKIAKYKKEHKMTILQVSRWDELLKDRLAIAKKLGLDDKFSKELYQQIHLMSIRIQTRVMNEKEENVGK
ncbi:MAG: cytochrome c4 [Cyclobacteriaceae bacterium]|nr:MAG: cytochrome c4 [Cyclobacteriaceae bacterium]